MKRKKNDYRAFMKKSGFKAREGKQVYISKETHDKIAMLVRWLGDGEVTIRRLHRERGTRVPVYTP